MALDTKLDLNGQPIFTGFNAIRNTEKAFENLLGIVAGIQSDIELTNGEVVFLQNWLADQAYLKDDPDVIDLLDALDSVLADGVITTEEKGDLSCLLNDFLEFRDEYVYFNSEFEEAIKRTTGIFSGISADDTLSDDEVYFLKHWLDSHSNVRNYWPMSEVDKAINSALADGVLTGSEKEFILHVLHASVGGSFSADGIAAGKTTELPLDLVEYIDFENKVFCFTGTMTVGTRRECIEITEHLGGFVSKGVTLKVDYLVLGPAASRDWYNTSYGRKIEKAVEYKKHHNSNISVISESDWLLWSRRVAN